MKHVSELFSRNLKILRIKSRMSQKQLAQELKLSWRTISEWERGNLRPTWENMIKISEFFNVSIDSLIRGEIVIEGKEPK